MKEINGVLYGLSYELETTTSADDLAIFNAVDTGFQYRAFNGRWYKQPVSWSAAPSEGGDGGDSGGGGGGSGASILLCEVDQTASPRKLNKTYGEVFSALQEGTLILVVSDEADYIYMGFINSAGKYDDGGVEKIDFNVSWGASWRFIPGTADAYPEEDMD